MPKNIYELFPRRNNTVTYVSQASSAATAAVTTVPVLDINDSDDISNRQQFSAADSIMGEGEESCVSSISDVSNASKRPRWLSQHVRSACLYCCRNKISVRDLRSADSGSDMMTTTTTTTRRRYNQGTLSQQLSDVSSNSPRSVLSEESTVPDRVTASILRHVQRMANPVLSKQSKMSLLEMKQKHPQSFQDICLYSEVSRLLGSCTYRMNARRFLQELFLDLDFDHFYNEATEILDSKGSLDRFLNEGQQHAAIHSMVPPVSKVMSTMTTTQLNGVEVSSGGGGPVLAATALPLTHIKSHLKSPQLESVYEASQENLSDSIASLKKIYTGSGSGVGGNITVSPLSKTQTTTTNRYHPHTNENYKNYRRPRFHTLELDLSCTKNKFPITDRRKEFSPTTLGGYQNRDEYLANFTRNLTATRSMADPVNTLHCEKRLKSYHSEATLSKGNADDDDDDTKI